MTESASSESQSAALAREIDERVSGDILVVGSPPPTGRDLDLLARPQEHCLVADWLEASGFKNRHGEWVRFEGCSVEVLDLIPSSAFALSESATEELFDQGSRLDGFRHLLRPAPHHLLLMLARWTAESDGSLSEKRRARIAEALEEAADAWRTAESRAAAWRARRSLAALQRAYTTGSRSGRRERAAALSESVYAAGRTPLRAHMRAWLAVLRRRAPAGRIVSFSGLDGAGKSSQVGALQQTLERLGFDVSVQWTRLEWTTLWENPWLGVLGWPARASLRLLARLRHRRTAVAADDAGAQPVLQPAALRERSTLISHVWVTIVALAHGLAQRRETRKHLHRGNVVICDRYTLDAAAQLRFRYGEQRNYGFQIGLVDRLSPRPAAAYLLDVPAATAYTRKAEQYSLHDLERQANLYREESGRLRVRRLDGELPRERLCADIAEEVWRALA